MRLNSKKNIHYMKVCHITSMHEWDDDRIYQRACLGLSKENIKVHLIVSKPGNIPKESNVNIHWIKKRSGWKRRWYSSKEAIKTAIEIKADIYHFHDPDLLPHVLKIRKKLQEAKIIYDIHENYAGRFNNWGLPSFFGVLFRKYEKNIISKIDGFAIVSESMKELFENVSTPAIIIRNSTDISRLSILNIDSNDKYNTPVIYTSGTNSHERNCIQTVKSLKYVDNDKPFEMMFVGRYNDGIEKEMMIQAKKDKTNQKLKILGMLPWEENFKRTAKAFCGCVFYADNPNNRVGIPNRLFEYMYCGLPVVATNFPELRKIIKDTNCGILVDSEDPESISKGFTYLLNNPEDAIEMGKRGKTAIETKYGYHIDLANLIRFYKKLID